MRLHYYETSITITCDSDDTRNTGIIAQPTIYPYDHVSWAALHRGSGSTQEGWKIDGRPCGSARRHLQPSTPAPRKRGAPRDWRNNHAAGRRQTPVAGRINRAQLRRQPSPNGRTICPWRVADRADSSIARHQADRGLTTPRRPRCHVKAPLARDCRNIPVPRTENPPPAAGRTTSRYRNLHPHTHTRTRRLCAPPPPPPGSLHPRLISRPSTSGKRMLLEARRLFSLSGLGAVPAGPSRARE